jgi:hypothetical protein
VAVISHSLWQRTLGGVPDVLDRDRRIGGVPVHIVGVLPLDSMWPAEQQIWLPLGVFRWRRGGVNMSDAVSSGRSALESGGRIHSATGQGGTSWRPPPIG